MEHIEQIKHLHEIFISSGKVSTDSRNIIPGSLFFALKGESFDGNDFAAQAIEAGAQYAVVDNPSVCKSNRFFLVDNVLETLQELAAYHREHFKIPVIALTGSNGKTTTKELITKVLSIKYRVLSTSGNLNNHIGVPLTLLNLDNSIEAAVIEMGASGPGEIARLSYIAKPTIGLITNVGKAHLLGFGSLEGVKKAKGELYDYMELSGGKVLYNSDNEHLREMVSKHPDISAIPYGKTLSGAVTGRITPQEPCLSLTLNTGEVVSTNLIGAYNADNVLAALAAGSILECNRELSIKAIESYVPTNNRSQLVKGAHNTLIVDAYNANPTSMKAALENFSQMEALSKGVVIGDMLELGDESEKEHRIILDIVSNMSLDHIFIVGNEFAKAAQGNPFYAQNGFFAPTSDILKEYLNNRKPTGTTILIKGSRGMRLEKVLDLLS